MASLPGGHLPQVVWVVGGGGGRERAPHVASRARQYTHLQAITHSVRGRDVSRPYHTLSPYLYVLRTFHRFPLVGVEKKMTNWGGQFVIF